MGFYSFGRIKIISRNGTKSAIATAAYHSGTKIQNEYDGIVHDFSKKEDVKETYIRMPDGVPEEWIDESIPAKERIGIIWNGVEMANTSGNARLARSNYIALPHNLTVEQGLECVDRFIQENCTSRGMGATYSLHDQPGNRHVDVMYMVNEYDQNGKAKEKSKKEYLCRNAAGEERYMDAETFKKTPGYEKVYKWEKGSLRANLTASEAKKEDGWNRINKYPVCRTIKTSGWDDKDLAKKWRKSWEVILNDKYRELGMHDRVDSRSFEERGVGVLPTIHEGWSPGKDEKKAYNQKVREFRKEVGSVYKEGRRALKGIESQIDDLQTRRQTENSLQNHEKQYATKERAIHQIVQSGFFSKQMASRFEEVLGDLSREMSRLIDSWRAVLKRLPEANKGDREPLQKKIEAAKAEQAAKNVQKQLRSMTREALEEKEEKPAKSKPEKHKKKSRDEGPEL